MKWQTKLTLGSVIFALCATTGPLGLNAGATPRTDDDPCLVTVDETSKMIVLPGGARLATRTLDSDMFAPVLESLNGEVRVELWKGQRPEEVKLSTHLLEELAEASLREVTTEDFSHHEETVSFDEFPKPERLDVLAMRVTTDSGTTALKTLGRQGETNCQTTTLAGSQGAVVAMPSGTSFSFPDMTTSASPSDWTSFNYKTFIPPASISSPCGTFLGDNRSWNTSYRAGSSRTIAAAAIDYTGRTYTPTRTVGKTVRTSPVHGEATASSAGIRFLPKGAATSYVSFEIAHAVGNPLCTLASPITYNAQVQMFKNGGVSVVASGIQVPNHEVYAYRRSGDRATVKQLTGKSFLCLAINCGNFSFIY